MTRSGRATNFTAVTSTRLTELGNPGPQGRLQDLARRLRAERAAAADSDELAAILEADGLTDESARSRFELDSVFDVAAAIFPDGARMRRSSGGLVASRRQEEGPEFPWALSLRGPLYLLPVLTPLAITQLLGSPGTGGTSSGATLALVAASAFGWGWSMALARLSAAAGRPGIGGPGTGGAIPGRALRLLGLLAVPLGALTSLAAALLSGENWLTVTLLGTLFSAALSSAGVLLALGRARDLLWGFVPPLLLALLGFLSPLDSAAAHLELTVLSGLLLLGLPAVLAARATAPPGPAISVPQLRSAIPHAVYGWASAGAVVTFAAQSGATALLPLVLGLGVLEALTWLTRSSAQFHARRARSVAAVQLQGVRVLGLSALSFLALLAFVSAVLWTGRFIGGAAALSMPLLGVALLMSAWLSSMGRLLGLTLLWLLTLVALLPSTGALLPNFGSGTLLGGASLPLLLLLLLAAAWWALGDLRSYR